jgi:hypothetical protein
MPAARAPQPRPEAAPRLQPRAAAHATPGRSKKSLIYVAIFVVAALGVGAVLSRVILSFV